MLWSSHLLNRCGCDTCIRDSNEDSLRHSMSRVNEYSALASPSLIALSSNDPILTAFQLSWELRNLAFTEPECRNEYMVSYLCTVEVKYFFGQKKKKKKTKSTPSNQLSISYSAPHYENFERARALFFKSFSNAAH